MATTTSAVTSAMSEHDRYVAAVARLRVLCAGLPASVHAALDARAVLARDAAYPHRIGGAS